MKKLTGCVVIALALCLAVPALKATDTAPVEKPATVENAVGTTAKTTQTGTGESFMGPGYAGRDKINAPARMIGPGVSPGAGQSAIGLDVAQWRVWAVMLIILLMLAGMFYVLKKFGRGILPNSSAQIITVKSKIQLDARNSVAVLRIYDEEYVIGAGTNGVNLLAKLLPIDGVESELEDYIPPEGEINKDKITAEFEKEFGKLIESEIQSEEIK